MSDYSIYHRQIEGVLDARLRIAEAIGESWPEFKRELQNILQRLVTAQGDELRELTNQLMALGMRSPAKKIFKEIGKQSRAGKVYDGIRLYGLEAIPKEKPAEPAKTADQLRQAGRDMIDELDQANYVNFTFTDVTEEYAPRELLVHEGFRSEGSYRLTVSMGLEPDNRFGGQGKQDEVERPDVDEVELYVAVFTKKSAPISVRSQPLEILRWPAKGPSTKNAEFELKVAPIERESSSSLDVYIYHKCNLLYTARFKVVIQIEDYEWDRDGRPITWAYLTDELRNRSILYRRFAHINQLSERGLNLAIQAGDNKAQYWLTAFVERAELPARVEMTREELNSNLVEMRGLMDSLRRESVHVEGGYTRDGTYVGDYISEDSGYDDVRERVANWHMRGDVFKGFMTSMALLGSKFYDNLFGSESAQLLRKAIEESLEEGDVIQIWIDEDASEFVYPWAWLYTQTVEPRKRFTVQHNLFWGYRYVVEQLPQYPETKTRSLSNEIPYDQLDVKVGTYAFERTTKTQKDYFKTLKERSENHFTYEVSDWDTRWEELLPVCASQILYFFSHGHTAKPATLADQPFYEMRARWKEWLEQPLEDSSEAMKRYRKRALESLQKEIESAALFSETYIRLQKGDLLLRELRKEMNLRESTPLVFLNMCESAQVFPNVSGGLVDVFLRKGARGVIGTEIPMLDSFADLFSREFFNALFYQKDEGKNPVSVGKILFDLRRKFLDIGNPLGFAYTLFGDATMHLSHSLPTSNSM